MTEHHPIPAITRSAFNLLKADFDRSCSLLAEQTKAVLHLPGQCHLDFDTGLLTHTVPDIAPTEPAST